MKKITYRLSTAIGVVVLVFLLQAFTVKAPYSTQELAVIEKFNLTEDVFVEDLQPRVKCSCRSGQCVADGAGGNQCNSSDDCSASSGNCFSEDEDENEDYFGD